jgi:hypothetical protein
LFEYIFWDAKKFPKVRNRFPILDIYKCPFSESARGLLKIGEAETIKNSYALKPKKKLKKT